MRIEYFENSYQLSRYSEKTGADCRSGPSHCHTLGDLLWGACLKANNYSSNIWNICTNTCSNYSKSLLSKFEDFSFDADHHQTNCPLHHNMYLSTVRPSYWGQ
jgi:hypothetical protein